MFLLVDTFKWQRTCSVPPAMPVRIFKTDGGCPSRASIGTISDIVTVDDWELAGMHQVIHLGSSGPSTASVELIENHR